VVYSTLAEVIEMKTKNKQKGKRRNLVAKYAKRFNKVHVFKDRKKSLKAGYSKHKKECERC
jgi:uncharacterized protein YycO